MQDPRYQLEPLGGELWGVECLPCGMGVVRSGLNDALYWIKAPGESDGSCNGGPTAGVWWPQYALGLAQRAAF